MQDARAVGLADQTLGSGRWASGGIAAMAVLLVGIALAAIKLFGPPDLMDNEQQRTAAYVLDMLQNHHWIVQRDQAWEIASKPPLYTWLAAIASWPLARPTEFSITLPAAVATVALAWVVYRATQKSFNAETALLAALAYLIAVPTIKQMGTARGDGLFALTVTLAALAAYRAWTRGRGWAWFWIAAAAATLAKQPGGVLMAGGGLLAVLWERHDPQRPKICRNWWIGIPLFLLLTLGWLLLAVHAMGPDVYHKLLIGELLRTTVPGATKAPRLAQIFIPPIYFITRFFPWSVLAVMQMWHIVFYPAPDPAQRRFERFIFWWIIVSLLCLCVAPHQRPDLLLPLFPPAAILAGRELASHLARLRPALTRMLVAIAAVAGVVITAGYFRFIEPGTQEVHETLAVQRFARNIDEKVGPGFPLTHVDDPVAVNFYLGTMRPYYFGPTKLTSGVVDRDAVATYDYEAAAQLLKGDAGAYVVVAQAKRLLPYFSPHELHELDSELVHKDSLHLLSNRPAFTEEAHMAMGVGPLRIETNRLKWISAEESEFIFAGKGSATFHNGGEASFPVRVRFQNDDRVMTHDLQPGENWQVEH